MPLRSFSPIQYVVLLILEIEPRDDLIPKLPTPFPEATPNNRLVPLVGEGPCGVVRYLALRQ
jgi:hypothetical protein